jgi:hypothetical protein
VLNWPQCQEEHILPGTAVGEKSCVYSEGKKNPVRTGNNYKIFFDGQFPGVFIRIWILLIIPPYGFLVIAIEKNSVVLKS